MSVNEKFSDEFYDSVVKNAEEENQEDDSDEEEAFADALDKLPQQSTDPQFDTTSPSLGGAKFKQPSPDDQASHSSAEVSDGEVEEEVVVEDELKLREEAEARLSPEDLEARHKESLELKTSANQRYVSNEFEEAVSIYSEALDKCPLKFKEDRAIFYSNRAAAKLKMDKKDGALEDCNEALKQNPSYLKALVRRAQLFESLDKPHESMKDYEEVLKLDPRHIEATVAVSSRLPEKIKEKDEKLKAEMMDNLKKLGNMVLNPFGLSTDNFNFVQDPNTGGYSVNFSK